MLRSGVLISNRYRLTDRVAIGGMGDVWRAEDAVLGRQIAVKMLLPALLADPDFIIRFRAEARMMAALRHPGIVQVYDCGEDILADGSRASYLVMEFVDGQPLSQRLAKAGHLPVGETMSMVANAAEALHAAHQAGIVHRDVKPGNLMIQMDGGVVLVDFGVARSTAVTSITSANAVPGTALYMAPEQAAGRPVSPATDIYALGAVAYHCLTGSPPFTAENALQVAVRHIHDELPPLPEELPASVTTLVERALSKNPADRFPDAEAMAQAAHQVLADPTAVLVLAGQGSAPIDGTGPSTRANQPAIRDETNGEPRRRSNTALAGAALATVLVGAGLAAVLAFAPPPEAPVHDPPAPTPSSAAPTEIDEGQNPDAPDRKAPDRTTRSTPTTSLTGTASPEPVEPTAQPTEPPAIEEPDPVETPSATSNPQPTSSPNTTQQAETTGGGTDQAG